MELPALAFAAYSAFSVLTFTRLEASMKHRHRQQIDGIDYLLRTGDIRLIHHRAIIKNQKLVTVNTKI